MNLECTVGENDYGRLATLAQTLCSRSRKKDSKRPQLCSKLERAGLCLGAQLVIFEGRGPVNEKMAY